MQLPLDLQHMPPSSVRMKRQQATRACIHCKRLHAKCSNERPCQRCTQNGLADSCVDSPRKQRVSKVLLGNGPSLLINDVTKQISIFNEPNKLMVTGIDGQTITVSDLASHYASSPKVSQVDLPPNNAADYFLGKNYKITYPDAEKTTLPPLYNEQKSASGSPIFTTTKLPGIYSSGSGISIKSTPTPPPVSPMSPLSPSMRTWSPGSYDKLFIPTDNDEIFNPSPDAFGEFKFADHHNVKSSA